MDLIVRVIAIALIVIIALYAASLLVQKAAPSSLTQEQAVALIRSDLELQNPNANVTITRVTPSVYAGSWHIVASVVSNVTSPCPSYSVDTFDYPQFSFVNGTDNVYTKWVNATKACYVYGAVASAPSAIAKSYALGIPLIRGYVQRIGFYNVTATAQFFNSTTLQGSNYTNVWLVRYASGRLNYSAYAVLAQPTGNLLVDYNG